MDKRQTLSRPIDGGEEIFFIEWRRPPTREAQARLYALTQAQNQFHRQTGALLIPRRGTLSPWASKATDIAHRCGLDCRLERGLWFAEEKQATAAHDRMTQTRLTPAAWRDWPAIFAPLPATVEEKNRPRRRPHRPPQRNQRPPRLRPKRQRNRTSRRLLPSPLPPAAARRAHDVRPSQLRTLSSQNLPRRMDGKRRITHGHDSPHPRRRPPRHHPRLHRQRRHHHRRRRRRIPP